MMLLREKEGMLFLTKRMSVLERIEKRMETRSTEALSTTRVTPTALFRYKQRHLLNAIFEPKSIAVIGATERPGSMGRTLLWNLISHPFGGTVFPVNPKRASVLGI